MVHLVSHMLISVPQVFHERNLRGGGGGGGGGEKPL